MALHTLHHAHKAVECCQRVCAGDAVIVMDEAAWALATIAALYWPCPVYVYADDLSISGHSTPDAIEVATADDWVRLSVSHAQHIAW